MFWNRKKKMEEFNQDLSAFDDFLVDMLFENRRIYASIHKTYIETYLIHSESVSI